MFTALMAILERGLLLFALHLQSGSFPRPLSSAEERGCFEAMAAGDRAARERLISHNLRLVAHVVKKYYSPCGDTDDHISIGTIGLIKAVDSFRFDRGARFATYAARCIENEILMDFRAGKKTRGTLYIDDPVDLDAPGGSLTILDVLSDDSDISERLELQCEAERLRSAVARRLFGRERIIVSLRFGLEGVRPHTQQQVADRLGISRSYVSRIEKKALESLREELRE